MHTRVDEPAIRPRRPAPAEAEPWPILRPLAGTLAEVCPFDPDLRRNPATVGRRLGGKTTGASGLPGRGADRRWPAPSAGEL
jgi:hypothetical protein